MLVLTITCQNYVVFFIDSYTAVGGSNKHCLLKVNRKAKVRKLYNQVPYLTRDSIRESDKKQRTQESQEVSHVPAGGHKTARNRQYSNKTNMKHKYQKGSI